MSLGVTKLTECQIIVLLISTCGVKLIIRACLLEVCDTVLFGLQNKKLFGNANFYEFWCRRYTTHVDYTVNVLNTVF